MGRPGREKDRPALPAACLHGHVHTSAGPSTRNHGVSWVRLGRVLPPRRQRTSVRRSSWWATLRRSRAISSSSATLSSASPASEGAVRIGHGAADGGVACAPGGPRVRALSRVCMAMRTHARGRTRTASKKVCKAGSYASITALSGARYVSFSRKRRWLAMFCSTLDTSTAARRSVGVGSTMWGQRMPRGGRV
jgi:hypothetical protein